MPAAAYDTAQCAAPNTTSSVTSVPALVGRPEIGTGAYVDVAMVPSAAAPGLRCCCCCCFARDCRWMSRNGATKASSYRSGVVGSTSRRCSYWKALRMNSIRSHVLHVKSRLRNSSCANIGGRRTSTRACRQGTVDSAGRRMERPPCHGHGRSIAEVTSGGARQTLAAPRGK
jgi:hypothetical protein